MLIPSILLSGIGLFMLYVIEPSLFPHQFWAVIIGIVAFFLIRRVDQFTLQRLWWLWYILAIILLVITYNTPEIRGAQRWIEIFGQRIQPSEIMKPFIVVAFAGFLSLRKKYNLSQFLIYTGLFIVPFLLVLKQPDLGNSVVYLFTYLAILFVSNYPLRYYLIPLVSLIVAGPVLWPTLEEYQKLRIISFINPSYDLQGAGYNAYQALIAVGSGGWFGKGLGAGTQSSLSFLPEYHTDFIFASIVEQTGVFGGLTIIILFAYLLIAALSSLKEGNMFVRMVVWGFFAQLLVQIVVNIGMNTGMVPITGITLPLISFGGSSIVAVFVSLGIISSFRHEKQSIIAIK